jgi:hypothetical protein
MKCSGEEEEEVVHVVGMMGDGTGESKWRYMA